MRLHRRKCNPETLTSLIRYTIRSKPKHLSQIFRWLHVNLIMKFAEARIQFVILIEKRNYENLNGNLPISELQWTIWAFRSWICTAYVCFINWCYNKLLLYYRYVEKDTLNLLIALIKSPIDPTDINGQKTFFLKIWQQISSNGAKTNLHVKYRSKTREIAKVDFFSRHP